MPASREEREHFGKLMGELRKQHGFTQREIASRLGDAGHDVTTQSISGWERGVFVPDRDVVERLDDLLEGGGQLLDALGYRREADGIVASLSDLLERVERIEALVEQLVSRPRGKRGASPRSS